MSKTVFPVILAGGASSRLWPASGPTRPKWDLPLFGGRTLLARAWERALAVAPAGQCFVVAGKEHRETIAKRLPDLPAENLLIEPMPRDTSGAVAFAAGHLLARDANAVMLVLPGDHLIEPVERFAVCARAAAKAAAQQGVLVTFGIVPRSPATCYGYVHRGEKLAIREAGEKAPPIFRVQSFKEKPDRATAEQYLKAGDYYWNGGIFAWTLKTLAGEFQQHLPGHAELAAALAAAPDAEARGKAARERFEALQKTSIDYGIMERAAKAGKVATVAADFAWDDVGSWTAVAAQMPEQEGNRAMPCTRVEAVQAKNNVVLAPGRRVGLVGVEGLAVVDDGEGLLVCKLEKDQDVKQIAQRSGLVKAFDIEVPTQGRTIIAAIAEPPEVTASTGFLLIMHGYGNSRFQYAETMKRWALRYDCICVSPEYRHAGYDADPNTGKGATDDYDFSHLQLIDCLNAYRAARLKYPQADGGRRYVWGGSQGGHLALLISAFAPRTFALGVDACGVTHLWREQFKARFDEAGQAIRDARRWVSRIRSPMVLFHGTADETVPAEQTREIAGLLAAEGKDFALRFIPGGDHFNRPVTTRQAVTEEMADGPLRTLRLDAPDDFDAKSVETFDCPGAVYTLDFSGPVATFTRKDAGA